MSEIKQAYPLQWPAGWRRTRPIDRTRARFSRKESVYRQQIENGIARNVHAYDRSRNLTVAQSIQRVLDELTSMGVVSREDIVISTNVQTRLDGLPRSGSKEPDDPGAVAYWSEPGRRESRCMAIDRYDRVADNLAALAATLQAMRAIERHGGATILDRAFMGFAALPSLQAWWQVLGLSGPDVTRADIDQAHRKLISQHHPDTGGDTTKAAAVNVARDQGYEAVR